MIARVIILLSLFTPASLPYIVNRSSSGGTVTRPDFTNVQMFLNQNFVPGFTNSDGNLQAVFTKQLGNALGVSNSAVIGSVLFLFSSAQELTKQTLSPDDMAGVSGLYSAPGSTVYGALGGALTLNGSPLRNALVSAVDPSSGTALATLTRPTDGTWSMAAPTGNYLVYAQPLVTGPNQFGDIIAASYLGLNRSDPVDTNFQPTFICGAGSGTTVSVTGGASSDASFSPGPASGASQTSLLTVNAVPVFPTTAVSPPIPEAS